MQEEDLTAHSSFGNHVSQFEAKFPALSSFSEKITMNVVSIIEIGEINTGELTSEVPSP